MIYRFHILCIITFIVINAFESRVYAQLNCLTIPENFSIDCGDVDWGFIYTNTTGVFVHPCDDLSLDLNAQIEMQVNVDSLNCDDLSNPNVVIQITRIFSSASGDLVDYGCGPGILCETQTIDVVDFEPPEFTVFPADTSVSCENWDLLDYLISGVFQVDFSDNCSDVNQTINLDTVSGLCAAEIEFRWEFSIIDGCNNTRIDTHIVNVVDTTGPAIIFLPPQVPFPTFECKDLVTWPLLTAFDMCSQVEEVEWSDVIEEENLSCPNHWTLSRWAFALDACGNMDSTKYVIEVKDEAPPSFIFIPSDMSFSCNSSPELGEPIAFDACLGSIDMDIVPDTIFSNCPQTFTINRTFIATDNCFNEASASQVIEVSDTEAPTLTIPSDFVVECGVEVQLENAIAIDHCDASPSVETETDTVNIQSAGTFTIIRTFTASDACGNFATGDQTIYIQDTSPPFFTEFPSDIIVPCGETFTEDMPVFQDGCDPSPILSNVITDENYQDCANESVVSRTFEIEDDAGNTLSQTQTITFIDDTPPFFTFVPSDITVGCTNDIEITDPEYDDLCSANGLTLTTVFEEQYLGCDDRYDQTRIYTITDACGLTTSANVTIFIRDTIAPLLETELDSLSFFCSYNVPSCEQMFSDLVFVDECGSEELSYSCSDILIEGNCEEQACLWERTYFWEDGCGNQSQASHVIRVEETAFFPTMPTGMTPNGDGANDAYVILDIGPLIAVGETAPCDWIDNTLFRVVNRWGQIVFEETNYRNDWEGTYTDGSPLPSGTYFIVFEANGEAFTTYVDLRR